MSDYRKYEEPTFEVYTFSNDIYITGFRTLPEAIKYCKSNHPVRYSIKKVIGMVE